jgi:hypothetical protein
MIPAALVNDGMVVGITCKSPVTGLQQATLTLTSTWAPGQEGEVGELQQPVHLVGQVINMGAVLCRN